MALAFTACCLTDEQIAARLKDCEISSLFLGLTSLIKISKTLKKIKSFTSKQIENLNNDKERVVENDIVLSIACHPKSFAKF